jgi:YHS domain-containing protein
MKLIARITGILLLISVSVSAQKGEIFSSGQGAIRGYDPVAYFKEGKPVKGTALLTYTWKGAEWHFASEENREAFAAAPEKYAPQYGGYCAYGTAEGHKAPTEPGAWTIINGKLYLNYSKSVQETWNKDQPGYIKKADANWPTVVTQK